MRGRGEWSNVNAPAEIIKLARDIQLRTFSPAGIFERDDGEMWPYCTGASSGAYRRRFPLNYQMGARHEQADAGRPGPIHPPPTEIGVFGFWERWRRQMTNRKRDSHGSRRFCDSSSKSCTIARPGCWIRTGSKSGWICSVKRFTTGRPCGPT